jgi:hypothetical protein
MTLLSTLFCGDIRLEGAAIDDSAHIVQGMSGEHVEKIQLALIQLDGAKLIPDGKYTANTADAVLAFKKKRRIINTAYQSAADNIVGRMTIATLDKELLDFELALRQPTVVEAVSPKKGRALPYRPKIFLQGLSLSSFAGAEPNPRQFSWPAGLPGPQLSEHFMEMRVGQAGTFQVTNGIGSQITVSKPKNIKVTDTEMPTKHEGPLSVYQDPHLFKIQALHPGSCLVNAFPRSNATRLKRWQKLGIGLHVRILDERDYFTKGVEHNHLPCRDWEAVKKHTNSGWSASDNEGDGLMGIIGGPIAGKLLRESDSPEQMVEWVMAYPFGNISKDHLNWYLHGKGEDFDEDENVLAWLASDSGIREKLAYKINEGIRARQGNLIRGFFSFPQKQYNGLTASDFLMSFGGIDRVDFAADLIGRTVKVWFQDKYEWHPNYPGLYSYFDDDERRPTNGIHAAFVEMKSKGAADYWMKGEATVNFWF